jgi:hypothetical protein
VSRTDAQCLQRWRGCTGRKGVMVKKRREIRLKRKGKAYRFREARPLELDAYFGWQRAPGGDIWVNLDTGQFVRPSKSQMVDARHVVV